MGIYTGKGNTPFRQCRNMNIAQNTHKHNHAKRTVPN